MTDLKNLTSQEVKNGSDSQKKNNVKVHGF